MNYTTSNSIYSLQWNRFRWTSMANARVHGGHSGRVNLTPRSLFTLTESKINKHNESNLDLLL